MKRIHALAPLLLAARALVGCSNDDAPASDEESSSTSGLGTTDVSVTLSTTTDTPTSGVSAESSSDEGSSDSGSSSSGSGASGSSSDSTGTDSTGEDSTETGEPNVCIDVSSGSALGDAVVTDGVNPGDTDDFTLSCAVDPDPPATGFADFVVEWTAPAAGDYLFETRTVDIDFDDTVLALFAPVCDPQAEAIDCNDDCFNADFSSALVYTAGAGETVFIVVEGYDGDPAEFVLNVSDAPPDFECFTD